MSGHNSKMNACKARMLCPMQETDAQLLCWFKWLTACDEPAESRGDMCEPRSGTDSLSAFQHNTTVTVISCSAVECEHGRVSLHFCIWSQLLLCFCTLVWRDYVSCCWCSTTSAGFDRYGCGFVVTITGNQVSLWPSAYSLWFLRYTKQQRKQILMK